MENRSSKTISDTTKLVFSQIINTIFSVVFFAVITQLFTKIEMSSLAVLSIITGITNRIVGLGLIGTCVQKLPELLAKREKLEACALMKATIIIPLGLSSLLGIVVFFYQATSLRYFSRQIVMVI